MNRINGISAVIPNYNGAMLLPEILPPLFTALKNSGFPHEVIIVDDFSSDHSVRWIKNNYPGIIIMKNEVNRGFSPTANIGMHAATFSHALLLNSDVKLTPGYFDTFGAYFDEPDTFGVMGRIVGWDDDRIQDGGKYPVFNGAKIKTSVNYIPVDPKKTDRMYSFYLSGANAFIDVGKFRAIGGFNELFAPFYVEDFELSLRAWRLGFKCYYDHFAVCRHKTSLTINTHHKKDAVKKIHYRNKMLVHALHLEGALYKKWMRQNKAELILQLLLGRGYYKKAYRAFNALKEIYAQQKKEFSRLQHAMNVTLTTQNVYDTIKQNLGQYDIKIF